MRQPQFQKELRRRQSLFVLAIDPGAHPGFALFDDEDNELSECGNVLINAYINEARVVYEKPFIYPHSKADPNTIITLAVTAGRLIERCSVCHPIIVAYAPRDWKGQIPKTTSLKNYIIYRRVLNALNVDERKELADTLSDISAKDGFDVVDAVGIGLHDLGRL